MVRKDHRRCHFYLFAASLAISVYAINARDITSDDLCRNSFRRRLPSSANGSLSFVDRAPRVTTSKRSILHSRLQPHLPRAPPLAKVDKTLDDAVEENAGAVERIATRFRARVAYFGTPFHGWQVSLLVPAARPQQSNTRGLLIINTYTILGVTQIYSADRCSPTARPSRARSRELSPGGSRGASPCSAPAGRTRGSTREGRRCTLT